MAPTHYNSEGLHNKAQAMLDALKAMTEQTSAHTELIRQNIHDTKMRLATTQMHLATISKELVEKLQHDGAVALEGSEHQLQKVMQDHLGHLSESAVEKLFAPKEISGKTVGEGQVDEEIRAKFVEILEDWSAEVQAFESVFQQRDYTTFLHDLNDTNIFANANNGTALDVGYAMPFPFPHGNTAHGVNYTETSLHANGNTTRDMVVECRFRAVVGCSRQANCSTGESNGKLTSELAKCDTLANISIFETAFVTAIPAMIFVIAFMLCLAFHLLSEREVRVFGLAVIGVYLVVHYGGM